MGTMRTLIEGSGKDMRTAAVKQAEALTQKAYNAAVVAFDSLAQARKVMKAWRAEPGDTGTSSVGKQIEAAAKQLDDVLKEADHMRGITNGVNMAFGQSLYKLENPRD
jgi:hypothetical protein